MHLEAVFDAPGDPTTVVSSYQKELQSRRWDTVEGFPGQMHGGFIPGAAGDGVMLRRGGQGPLLMVDAVAQEGAPVDLRVFASIGRCRATSATRGQCSQRVSTACPRSALLQGPTFGPLARAAEVGDGTPRRPSTPTARLPSLRTILRPSSSVRAG